MNKNKLARAHGHGTFDEMLRRANAAEGLRKELATERARNAPLTEMAERAKKEWLEAVAERRRLARAWAELAELYEAHADSLAQHAGSSRVIANVYRKNAASIEADVGSGVSKGATQHEERQGRGAGEGARSDQGS